MADTVGDQFNLFMENYNKNTACDSECQRAEELATLKQNYLNALNNLETAPQQVQTTYQDYLTFAEGGGAYQRYQQGSLQQQAQDIATQYQTNFDTNINNSIKLLNTYSGLYTNYNNIMDLSQMYKEENYELENNIETGETDVITNERKTFYENQATESLQSYYWILSIIYTAIIIYYIISLLIYPSQYRIFVKIICLLILIIYPFISLQLFLKIISLYYYIISLLPKNQYSTL